MDYQQTAQAYLDRMFTPTWEHLNRARSEWLADVAAQGGPVRPDRLLFTSQERGALDLLWEVTLLALDSGSVSLPLRDRTRQALETIRGLMDSAYDPPPCTVFWLGAEGEG